MTKDTCGPSVSPGDPSWWFADAMQAEKGGPASPILHGEVHADVAIVGGGFTGLWTALALRERAPHLSIVLIEASLCGSGASGKNGGKVHGYWASLANMAANIGTNGALAVARAGARAQDAKIAICVEAAARLGVPDAAYALTPEEVARRCRSPVFRGGVFFPEGANVHPARLARELRRAALTAGVAIYENTPMTGVDPGAPNRVRTPNGQIVARDVVLATNIALAKMSEVMRYVSVFSSYAVMTEPAAERLEAMGWTGDEGLADMRMFVHYFRKTRDGRVLMGSGSGPISYAGDAQDPRLTLDRASAARAEKGLRRLLPAFADVPLANAWGAASMCRPTVCPCFARFRIPASTTLCSVNLSHIVDCRAKVRILRCHRCFEHPNGAHEQGFSFRQPVLTIKKNGQIIERLAKFRVCLPITGAGGGNGPLRDRDGLGGAALPVQSPDLGTEAGDVVRFFRPGGRLRHTTHQAR
jgi:glycine/D-amino acid oxidase-like deaminating enzyme